MNQETAEQCAKFLCEGLRTLINSNITLIGYITPEFSGLAITYDDDLIKEVPTLLRELAIDLEKNLEAEESTKLEDIDMIIELCRTGK